VLNATDGPAHDLGHVVARANLEAVAGPLLEALAKLGELDSTYITVFDWDRREEEVRFLRSTGAIEIGSRQPVAEDLSSESVPGVTRHRVDPGDAPPPTAGARFLAPLTYVGVPILLAEHELYGMVRATIRRSSPVVVGGPVIMAMQLFARIIADHVTRARAAATERRAEVAEEQLRARARYLAQADHQLKTPLSVLIGTLRLLRDDWADLGDDKRERCLEMATRSAQTLSDEIDGLLVEAKAEVQSRELIPIQLDLVDLTRKISQAFNALSNDHQVRSEVEEGLTTWADPAVLDQVLGHLLDNAIKYSPAGGLIRVVGQKTAAGVEMAVIDQGVGLPEGIDIFEPFVRGDEMQVGILPGVGLGLHIVRNLVEATGGSVRAQANAGAGTTFTVTLPARE